MENTSLKETIRYFTKQAGIHFRREEYDLAVDLYTEAIKLNDRDHMLWVNRSHCQWMLGNHEAALEDSNKALELSPISPEALNNKLICLNHMGRNSEANELLIFASSVYPNFKDYLEKEDDPSVEEVPQRTWWNGFLSFFQPADNWKEKGHSETSPKSD